MQSAERKGLLHLYGRPKGQSRRFVEKSGQRSLVDFCSCSYLGLDRDKRIVEGAKSALDKYGGLHSVCASTRLNYTILEELEKKLSDFFRCHVVTFGSTTLANISLLPLIAAGLFTENSKPIMVFDKQAHASMFYTKPVCADETIVETIEHNDLRDLERFCRSSKGQWVVYVCDGIYSMGGRAPLKELQDLQRKYDLLLYIDDAHGISIMGENGIGYAHSCFRNRMGRTIIVTSLSKGFGASGAVACFGSRDQKWLASYFGLSSAFAHPLSVPAIGAALASLEIHRDGGVNSLQWLLHQRITLFDQQLKTATVGEESPIRMIEVGKEEAAIEVGVQLKKAGFILPVTFFPTVAKGKAGLRVCINAIHSDEDIIRLCDTVKKLL